MRWTICTRRNPWLFETCFKKIIKIVFDSSNLNRHTNTTIKSYQVKLKLFSQQKSIQMFFLILCSYDKKHWRYLPFFLTKQMFVTLPQKTQVCSTIQSLNSKFCEQSLRSFHQNFDWITILRGHSSLEHTEKQLNIFVYWFKHACLE